MRTRRRYLTAIALVCALGLYGCGDDDDDTASGSASGSVADDGEPDLEAYCEKTVEVETLGEPEIDFESASEDEVSAALKAFMTDEVLPVAHEIAEVVPDENRENVETLVGLVEDMAETGDPSGFDSPEWTEASQASHAFDIASCDWNVVEVSAVNYAFEGLPTELEAGVASFELSNDGTELHELVLLRKKDGTTESFDELLTLPQEQAEGKVDFVGSAFGAPGEEGLYAVADLTAGEYLAICFIPVGTVDEQSPPSGPPHFTQGMKQELTVA